MNNNTNDSNKTTDLKTLLMLSVVTMMMLIPGGIIPVHAAPGGILLTINNPTPAAGDLFGISVATTPTGDLLAGSIFDDTVSTDAGTAYLFDGTDGSLLLTINNPTPAAGDDFGRSIAATPTGDLLIGAGADDTGALNAGSAYLFDGTDGTLLLTINNPTPTANDQFGNFVAVTPNGDLLVDASREDTGATDTGSVYLFDGTDGSLLLTINNPTPEIGDNFGRSIAATPTGDLLIGAHYDDTGVTDAGSAYLFDGTDGSLLLTINNPTPTANDQFGNFVAVTPNGDLLVSSILDDTGATDAGSVYLFDGTLRGTTSTPLLTINNPTPETGDQFGLFLAVTPNGDLFVSSIFDDTGATDAGSVYLFDGTDGTLLLTIHNPTSTASDYFGRSVAVTPTGDLLVGAYEDDTGATNTGIVYLFEGILPSMSAAPIITSLLADDPDDLDEIYSNGDTITMVFDLDTNTPGGTEIQTRFFVDDMFTFTESLGTAYRGQWTAADTFTITIHNANNAGPPIISGTTVTPAGITPILSTDGMSEPSHITSPVLSGDFGIIIQIIDWIIGAFNSIYYIAGNVGIGTDNPNSKLEVTNGYIELDVSSGIPPAADCDNTNEIGRMKVDDSSNNLYVCTNNGWQTFQP